MASGSATLTVCVVVTLLFLGVAASVRDTVVVWTAKTQPGFQARITQHALDYANQQLVKSLASQVQKASIPDQSGSSGSIHYSLTNIRITRFITPASTIKLVPNKGLKWSVTNLGVDLHSDWRVKYKKGWVHMSFSGNVDVSVRSVTFSLTMVFGTDSTGRPSVKSGGCSCNIGSVDVDIHGDLSFILNLFKGQVEKKIRDLLPGMLCKAADDQINSNAESQLRKIKVMTPLINNLFMLDYRLVSPPSFQSAYMETYHKGEITWNGDPQSPPIPPSPLPPSPSSNRMLYLWVGEYVPQSFVFAAQKHGFLRYNMTTKDLPDGEKSFLNTTCTSLTCIGLLFPPVSQKYPNHTVTLRMNSTAVPQISMSPNCLQARFVGDIAAYIDTPSGPPPYLLTIGVSAVFNMTATVTDQLIKGNISSSSFKVKVLKSAVGPLESKMVNTMVNLAMRLFIIPKINEEGNRGFPLPVTDDVKFVNTELQIQQDALMIATDLVVSFDS